MKQHNIRQTALGLLTIFSLYIYAIENDSSKQKVTVQKLAFLDINLEEKHTIDYLNKIRKESGLISINVSDTLNKSAKNHANYLIKNYRIGHYEDENRTGYTGKFGSNRSVYVGYATSMIIENVSSNNRSYKESIDGLMAAIYHRFGFLDFHIDEIGLGIAQNLQHRALTAFVYDMGSSKLTKLCKEGKNKSVEKPLKNICADSKSQISKIDFMNAINAYKDKNSKVVVYPYPNQEDVSPVFYEELPDPLPNHGVSGFPISMSLNPVQFKSVEVLSFQLFNENNEEITDTIFYNHKTDPNKKLKKYEFALFPLHRLDWNTTYNVRVSYEADGIIKSKEWSFHTRTFDTPLYTVTGNQTRYRLKKNETVIFYFPPLSSHDTLGNLQFPSILDITFVDKNTIKLRVKETFNNTLILKFGKHELRLEIASQK